MRFGVRKLNITLISIGSAFFIYQVIENPGMWILLAIYLPISVIVVFDSGRAEAIDKAYNAVKHLKGKSEQADLMLMALARQQIRGTIPRLACLKVDFPSEEKEIMDGIKALEKYMNTKPWWHLS